MTESVSFSTNLEKEILTTWSLCLERIHSSVPPNDFSAWIEPIIPISLKENSFVLLFPSQFSSAWVETKFGKIISDSISQVLGKEITVEYTTRNSNVEIETNQENLRINLETSVSKQISTAPTFILNPQPSLLGTTSLPKIPNTLNSRFVFDNFIKGDSNRLAYSASRAVAQNPGGTEFNPLVIYGGVGLGKTHLIQAIGNFAKENKKAERVLYLTSQEFLLNFMDSIKEDKGKEFNNLFRSLDILIVDDIQFFTTGEKTQETFFHLFNALHQSGKQIILSSDRAPNEIKSLDSRLISRFQMALIADIQPPALEMRLAILYKKSEALDIALPKDVAEIIAQNITSNVRQLEGCLISMMAKISLENKKLDINLAKEVLKTIVGSINSYISIQTIQSAVSKYYNIHEDLLRGRSRKQEIVIARQVAMYLAKELTQSTYQSIGLNFGGRDHTTVIHAYQTIDELIKEDEKSKTIIEEIKSSLNNTHI